MAKKKIPASKIVKVLKRTEGVTRQKAFSIGLSLDTERDKPDALAARSPNRRRCIACQGTVGELVMAYGHHESEIARLGVPNQFSLNRSRFSDVTPENAAIALSPMGYRY